MYYLRCYTLLAVLFILESTTATIGRPTLQDLEYWSQYAAASYCSANTDATQIHPGENITCPVGNTCPTVQAAGATYLSSVNDFSNFTLAYLIAYDYTHDKIVLSFRGAKGAGVQTQRPMTLTPCDVFCPTCECWAGFYSSWLLLRDSVVAGLRAALRQYPSSSLVVTGHSLGAIQAVYAAGELRANGTLWDPACVLLYTYGQPRSGNERLAALLTSQGGNFRVTHTDDPAPRMGDRGLGFRHLSPEYWINPDRNLTTFEVRPQDISVVEGFDSIQGNAGTGGYDIPAHVEYFQPQIGGCLSNDTRTHGLPYSQGGDVGGIVNGTNLTTT